MSPVVAQSGSSLRRTNSVALGRKADISASGLAAGAIGSDCRGAGLGLGIGT